MIPENNCVEHFQSTAISPYRNYGLGAEDCHGYKTDECAKGCGKMWKCYQS